jgi:outer membrane protein assembly factor BamB
LNNSITQIGEFGPVRISFVLLLSAQVALNCPTEAGAQERSILTYHGDVSRSGNLVMPLLTWEKVRSVHLDRAFDGRVSGHIYAQPLYWHGSESNRALLFVATEDNIVQALDANTGKAVWQRSLGSPVPRSALPCGNINPLGITGTPVIDEVTQAIYVDAAIDDRSGPRHQIFALSLNDGSTLKGWSIDVAAALRAKGLVFNPRDQNQRAALTILDDVLYVPFGGHFGDCGDYHGWIIGVPLHDPGKVISWQTRARGGGVWAPGGPSVSGHSLFVATGNTFGARGWSDGEAVWRLAPDLHRTLDKKDFFAPSNWQVLDQRDADLGATNPVPIDVPTRAGAQPLMLALGKDRRAYLLDRNNLGGIGGQLNSQIVSERSILTSPAVYPADGGVYIAFRGEGTNCPTKDNGLTVLKIEAGSPPKMTTAWCGALRGAGSPMVTTTDGHSNSTVWIVGAEGDNQLHAFRGDTGEPLLAGGEAISGLRHFQTLIAGEDRLYVAADGRIYAFSF